MTGFPYITSPTTEEQKRDYELSINLWKHMHKLMEENILQTSMEPILFIKKSDE